MIMRMAELDLNYVLLFVAPPLALISFVVSFSPFPVFIGLGQRAGPSFCRGRQRSLLLGVPRIACERGVGDVGSGEKQWGGRHQKERKAQQRRCGSWSDLLSLISSPLLALSFFYLALSQAPGLNSFPCSLAFCCFRSLKGRTAQPRVWPVGPGRDPTWLKSLLACPGGTRKEEGKGGGHGNHREGEKRVSN